MIDTKNLRMLAHDFKLAGSPVVIQVSQMTELLDHLERAEKECDKLKKLNSALHTNSNSQVIHNARLAEENCALRAENAGLVDDMNLIRNNNVALRARIEEMEQQEPIGEMREISHLNWELAWFRPVPFGAKLFTSPGAKGE